MASKKFVSVKLECLQMDERMMLEEEIKMLKEIVKEKEESQSIFYSVFEAKADEVDNETIQDLQEEIIALKMKSKEDQLELVFDLETLKSTIVKQKSEIDMVKKESRLVKDENIKMKELCKKSKVEELKMLKTLERDQKQEINALKAQNIKVMCQHEEIIKNMNKNSEKDRVKQESLISQLTEETKKSEELAAKHKLIVGKLSDKVECPVCLEVPRAGPVPVCPNGHIVCKKCKKTTCPTCRVAMGNGKSLLASTLLENIEHRCKFDACEEYFALGKLDDHEKDCWHRIVTCPFIHCPDEKIALSKLGSHLRSSKKCCWKASFTSAENSLEVSFGYALTSETNMEENVTFPTNMFYLDGHGLCVTASKDGGQFYISCVLFCSEAVCNKYKVEMTVHPGRQLLDSDVSVKFSGKPSSIDEDYNETKYYGLVVNAKAMGRISKKGGGDFFISLLLKKV